jgi:hypothetical protein
VAGYEVFRIPFDRPGVLGIAAAVGVSSVAGSMGYYLALKVDSRAVTIRFEVGFDSVGLAASYNVVTKK